MQFSSQRREMLLFLFTNMAAMTSRANKQYIEVNERMKFTLGERLAANKVSSR